MGKELMQKNNSANERRNTILKLKRTGAIAWLELGKQLHLVEKNKDYLEFKFKSMHQYMIASEKDGGLDLTRRWLLSFKLVYETYILRFRLSTAKILLIEPTKLSEIRSVINEDNLNKWLDRAKILPLKKIREEIKKEKYVPPPPAPKGEYKTIIIDPPWNYGTEYDAETRRVASPYPEMSLDELKAIELPAYKDCVLWLWTTNGFMREAYILLEVWGFEPKTILTWDKVQIGIGYWLRGQTEHCILATKGKPNWVNTKYTTLIKEQRTKHSKKPDIFYKRVEEICEAPRIDMFARDKKEGFDSWGNEI